MFKVRGNPTWRTGVIRYSGRDGMGRDGTGRDGTGRDGTLTEVCSHLAIGYSLSLGVGVGGGGIPVD